MQLYALQEQIRDGARAPVTRHPGLVFSDGACRDRYVRTPPGTGPNAAGAACIAEDLQRLLGPRRSDAARWAAEIRGRPRPGGGPAAP